MGKTRIFQTALVYYSYRGFSFKEEVTHKAGAQFSFFNVQYWAKDMQPITNDLEYW